MEAPPVPAPFPALRGPVGTGSAIFFAAGYVGSVLEIDGVSVGRLPARVKELSEGPHEFRVVNGWDGGAQEFTCDVRLTDAGRPSLEKFFLDDYLDPAP